MNFIKLKIYKPRDLASALLIFASTSAFTLSLLKFFFDAALPSAASLQISFSFSSRLGVALHFRLRFVLAEAAALALCKFALQFGSQSCTPSAFVNFLHTLHHACPLIISIAISKYYKNTIKL